MFEILILFNKRLNYTIVLFVSKIINLEKQKRWLNANTVIDNYINSMKTTQKHRRTTWRRLSISILTNAQKHRSQKKLSIKKSLFDYFKPYFGGEGGGGPWDPTLMFLEVTQKVLVWGCLNFLTFLTITCPSLKAQSGAFIPTAWVLMHTAGHWILTYISSLESLKQEKADCTNFAKKFCIFFCTDAFKENLHIFSFPCE